MTNEHGLLFWLRELSVGKLFSQKFHSTILDPGTIVFVCDDFKLFYSIDG